MSALQSGEVTELLLLARQGSRTAEEQLAVLILPELEKIASRLLRHEAVGQTLRTGDLVNEIYLKLQPGLRDYNDSAHFKAYAAKLMRWKLTERARRRTKQKAGLGQRVDMEEVMRAVADADGEVNLLQAEQWTRLNDALEALSVHDPRAAQVVEQKIFGGMTNEEIAQVIGKSTTVVKREWRAARAYLAGQLG